MAGNKNRSPYSQIFLVVFLIGGENVGFLVFFDFCVFQCILPITLLMGFRKIKTKRWLLFLRSR